MGELDQGQNGFGVLIADDEASSRETLRGIVEPLGYKALVANSPEAAMDIIRTAPVHIALLDFNMPKMSGLELLQMARQWVLGLPAILVTADPSVRVMREAQRADVFSVIPKPVSRSVVVYTVTRALAQRYGQSGGVPPTA